MSWFGSKLNRFDRLLNGLEEVVTRLLNVTSALEAIVAAPGSGTSPEQLAAIRALTETIRVATAKQVAAIAANTPKA